MRTQLCFKFSEDNYFLSRWIDGEPPESGTGIEIELPGSRQIVLAMVDKKTLLFDTIQGDYYRADCTIFPDTFCGAEGASNFLKLIEWARNNFVKWHTQYPIKIIVGPEENVRSYIASLMGKN